MSQRLNSFFTGNPKFRELAQKARQLAALERLYRAATPSALAGASRVIGFERHILVVGADNNAVAAKLRHLAPRILQKAQERENANQGTLKITGILVKVQVSQPAPPRAQDAHILSSTGRQQVADLAATLKDTPLKRALLRLIRR